VVPVSSLPSMLIPHPSILCLHSFLLEWKCSLCAILLYKYAIFLFCFTGFYR
jgi:hypothetical protein